MKLRRDSKPFRILKAVARAGGILLLTAVLSTGSVNVIPALVKYYIRKKRFEREKFLRDLKHLQNRKLLNFEELPNGEIKIVLTRSGRREMLKFDLDEIKLDSARRWDGRWRLAVFDIPHDKRRARDALRTKLLQIGFYPLQKSVFITPYECEREIDFIGTVFEVRDYILILYVSHFEGAEKLRHHFEV